MTTAWSVRVIGAPCVLLIRGSGLWELRLADVRIAFLGCARSLARRPALPSTDCSKDRLEQKKTSSNKSRPEQRHTPAQTHSSTDGLQHRQTPAQTDSSTDRLQHRRTPAQTDFSTDRLQQRQTPAKADSNKTDPSKDKLEQRQTRTKRSAVSEVLRRASGPGFGNLRALARAGYLPARSEI